MSDRPSRHLLKAVEGWTDLGPGDFDLRYLRDKSKREVDFLLIRDRKPWVLVEVKTGDRQLSPALGATTQSAARLPGGLLAPLCGGESVRHPRTRGRPGTDVAESVGLMVPERLLLPTRSARPDVAGYGFLS